MGCIVGIVSKDDSDVSEQIKQMLNRIKHKGPNGFGLLVGGKIYRGHTLEELKELNFDQKATVAMGYVDSDPQQPLQGSNKRLTVVYNGEIYNYRELQKN
ncbi:MAG TPA: hypothetical protein ENF36_09200 [Desulfobacteraceae bacterium]|nr:MAG: hypothetical protein DRP09_14880 [Candidatus Thorarchaeota archaeon]HDH88194.1 hypothetical protein [Desulfobacteraceae bacterium]